jgi:hypothetical protein
MRSTIIRLLVLTIVGVNCLAVGAMATTSEDASKATDAETCGEAFDLTKNDWNFNYSNRHWLAEATKRKLGVAIACRFWVSR